MDKPDVEMEFERDENGFVTRFAYKVNNPGEDNRRALEATTIATELMVSEGPEDHRTSVDVHFSLGSL